MYQDLNHLLVWLHLKHPKVLLEYEKKALAGEEE